MKKFIVILSIIFTLQSVAYAEVISQWATKDYSQASESGLLSYNVIKNNLKGEITREEFAELSVALFKQLSNKIVTVPRENPFEDTDNPLVLQAYSLGIVNGKSETLFDPEGTITREQITKIIINTLKSANIEIVIFSHEDEKLLKCFEDINDISDWAYIDMMAAVKYKIISGTSETTLLPKGSATREQAISLVNRVCESFVKGKVRYKAPTITNPTDNSFIDNNTVITFNKLVGIKKYVVLVKDENGNTVLVKQTAKTSAELDFHRLEHDKQYAIICGVEYVKGAQTYSEPIYVTYSKILLKPVEVEKEDQIDKPQVDENNNETDVDTDIENNITQDVPDKILAVTDNEKRVFPEGYYYQSEEEAKKNMVEVTIKVWNVDGNGEKYSAERTLEVNKHLSEDVVKIFDEIYNEEGCFPIKAISGYCWRTTAFGKPSQHSFGTCIDINPDENYYCYYDTKEAIVGEYWKPGEDIYSITPDGIVVSTFEKYGWSWGGNWTGSVTDYMHFTYLGK